MARRRGRCARSRRRGRWAARWEQGQEDRKAGHARACLASTVCARHRPGWLGTSGDPPERGQTRSTMLTRCPPRPSARYTGGTRRWSRRRGDCGERARLRRRNEGQRTAGRRRRVQPRQLAPTRTLLRGAAAGAAGAACIHQENKARQGQIAAALCGSGVVVDLYDARTIAASASPAAAGAGRAWSLTAPRRGAHRLCWSRMTPCWLATVDTLRAAVHQAGVVVSWSMSTCRPARSHCCGLRTQWRGAGPTALPGWGGCVPSSVRSTSWAERPPVTGSRAD